MIYWILFIISSAVCEAFLYNIMNPDKKNPVNEHFFFNVMRLVVFIGMFHSLEYMELLYTAIAASLIFPFIHDTTYYLTRHLLDKAVYPDWYWTTSTTSTAISDRFLNATVRLILLIFGLFIIDHSGASVAIIMTAGFLKGIYNTIR